MSADSLQTHPVSDPDPHTNFQTDSSEKPGRILVLAPQPFYRDRGTPIALRRVLEAASERGERVDLITFPMGEEIELPGLRIFRIGKSVPVRDVPIGLSLRKMFLDLLLIPSLIRLTRREKYRWIHAVEEAAFLAVLLRPWHGAPVLYDMQSSLPEQLAQYPLLRTAAVQRLLAFFERWVIRRADRIVCSSGLRDHVLSVHPSAAVQEWFFPFLPATFTSDELSRLRDGLGISPATRIVLYTGNFEPYQGLSRLIRSIPGVLARVPDVIFILVGGHAPDNPDLYREAAEFQERGVLKLVARQPKSIIQTYLAMADVLVSPRELGRNIGLKVFEYMAAGKPIVATNTPAHRSLLNEDRAVLVNLNAEDLGAGIARLLNDPDAARRLAKAAKEYAENYLAWKTFLCQVSDLYTPASVGIGEKPIVSSNARPGSSRPSGMGRAGGNG